MRPITEAERTLDREKRRKKARRLVAWYWTVAVPGVTDSPSGASVTIPKGWR